MTHKVFFTPTARRHALQIADYIAERSPRKSARWYAGLEKVISSLHSMPNKYGRARESDFLGEELKQHIYGNYRVIFAVNDSPPIVHVLDVRHAARRAIGEPDPPDTSD